MTNTAHTSPRPTLAVGTIVPTWGRILEVDASSDSRTYRFPSGWTVRSVVESQLNPSSPLSWTTERPSFVGTTEPLASARGVGVDFHVIVDDSFAEYVVVCSSGFGPAHYSATLDSFAAAWALLDAALRFTSPELFPAPVAAVAPRCRIVASSQRFTEPQCELAQGHSGAHVAHTAHGREGFTR